MSKTLIDPVLGTLTRRSETLWASRVWLTPKHEIEVVFDQWTPRADDVPEQLARAREAYLNVRQREWSYRRRTAQDLIDHPRSSVPWRVAGVAPPTLAELARQLRLVRVNVFGDQSANIIYHAPAFVGKDILGSVGIDGSYDGHVSIFDTHDD